MALTPTTTLAEVASAYPSLIRELERLGLDYCCGGRRSLAEACRERSLEAEVVVAELARLPIAPHSPAGRSAIRSR
jgi:regulator of cell morphogenesis and NO signaling